MTGVRGERLYRALIDEEGVDTSALPESVVEHIPRNAARHVVAHTLQNVGDFVVDAKTVLAWLLAAVGAPAGLVGLLVPIRDAGSLLPQVFAAPVVRRLRVRKWVWVAGALLQAVSVLAMALVAATLDGAAAGAGILVALSAFALARSLSSFASKDVLGRTLPKGQRGQVNGLATVGAGVAAVTVGLGLRVLAGADTDPVTFAWLLGGGAAAWVAAAAVFATVEEMPDEPRRSGAGGLGLARDYLRDDAPFRRFVCARSLLLVSALSPPFVVVLATQQADGAGLAGLGSFVAANGIAALLAGRFWGRRSDRSSRGTMALAAGLSSAIVLLFLGATLVPKLSGTSLLYPATYLLLAITHTGSRIGRKTYVIDLAEGTTRTDHIAVSNSVMGIVLLAAGAVTAGLAVFGAQAALLFLSGLGVAGVLVSISLPEVSAAPSDRRA